MALSYYDKKQEEENTTMKKRLLAVLCCLTLTASIFAGCGGKKTDDTSTDTKTEKTYKDTIVYSLDSTPTGDFLPVQSGSDYNTSVMGVIHGALLVADAEGNLEDYLAESHEISDDGTVITFHLRDNAYFSDGEKVTADDVAFTFNYMCDPADQRWAQNTKMFKGIEAYKNGETDSVEGIKVIDDKTVEFTMNEYYPKALSFVGQNGIIPKHIWKDIPYGELEKHRELLEENTVGCGPYHIVEFVQDEYVKLEANDNFFLGDVATKYFYFRVTNADSLTTELRSGTIDIAAVTNLLKSELDQLDNDGFDIKYFPYDLVQNLVFNSEGDMAVPEAVRVAIRYGIDVQGFIDNYMEGRATATPILISAGSWAFPSDVKYPAQDLEKAKKTFADAGYKDVDGDGFVEDPNGNPYTFRLVYPTGLSCREQFAVVFQEEAKKFGMKVELISTDFPSLMKIMKDPSSFEGYLMGFGVDSVDPDLYHFAKYYDECQEACDLLLDARKEIDQNQRIKIYAKTAEILKSAPTKLLTLYCQQKAYAYRDTIENYAAGSFNNFYHVYEWKMSE